jgi:hypothetical protein
MVLLDRVALSRFLECVVDLNETHDCIVPINGQLERFFIEVT